MKRSILTIILGDFAKEDNLKITKLISPQDKYGKPIVAILLEINNLLELFAKARPHCKKQDAQCRKSESTTTDHVRSLTD